jgi:queuosine precursor transporter
MFNELLFLSNICIVALFTLASLYLGKETLIATICLYGILANLFVTKQIMLFGLDCVTSDVFMVGAILGLNMLQEHYGPALVRKAIIANFLTMIFYVVVSMLFVAYTPSSFDSMQTHFEPILSPMLRIMIASISVYFITQLFDANLYRILKNRFGSKHLVLRNVVSLSTTQLLDTVLFSFAGLYGLVHSVWHIIIVSYTIKVIVICCSSPFIALSKKLFRKDS